MSLTTGQPTLLLFPLKSVQARIIFFQPEDISHFMLLWRPRLYVESKRSRKKVQRKLEIFYIFSWKEKNIKNIGFLLSYRATKFLMFFKLARCWRWWKKTTFFWNNWEIDSFDCWRDFRSSWRRTILHSTSIRWIWNMKIMRIWKWKISRMPDVLMQYDIKFNVLCTSKNIGIYESFFWIDVFK